MRVDQKAWHLKAQNGDNNRKDDDRTITDSPNDKGDVSTIFCESGIRC